MNLSPEQKAFVWGRLDIEKPYRVCSPEFTIGVQRFETQERANLYMLEMKERGHQSIMSFVNIETCKVEIKGYEKGSKYKKKKE